MNSDERKSTALVPIEGDRLPVPQPPVRESYWAGVSARYAMISRALIVILLLFAVLFLLVFSRVFTYDSLFSFVKDMQTVSSFVPSGYDTIYAMYEGGENVAAFYRGSVAFVGRGGIEIYAPDGTRLLDVTREFSNPRVSASEKYLLAFDHGGKAFSVTNSYGELLRGESEFPILGATVSNDGYFALITTAKETISRVVLYDNNFHLIRSIDRNSATVGAAFFADGSLAIFGATAAEGSVFATVNVYDEKLENVAYSASFANEVPLAVDVSEADTLFLLTDKALRACDSDCTVESKVDLTGAVKELSVGASGAVLVQEIDPVTATNSIVACEADGSIVYEGTYKGDVYAAASGNNEVFLLCVGSVMRISTKDGAVQTMPVETGATSILAVGARQLRVVYGAKAVFVEFENS